jgi:hypothetical protein
MNMGAVELRVWIVASSDIVIPVLAKIIDLPT